MDHNAVLSIRRQCALLGISRSSAYYRPRRESRENRALMQRLRLEAIYRKPRTSLPHPDHHIPAHGIEDRPLGPSMVRRHHPPYIPVSSGFLYLIAIMDWASRHLLAWRPSNTTDSGFCVEALDAALRTGTPGIFDTDQGAQFPSVAFTGRVEAAGARCSMDGRGPWLENVFIVRLWRAMKYEGVYAHEMSTGFAAEWVIAIG